MKIYHQQKLINKLIQNILYNDFKDLYKKLQELQYQLPVLPNEPNQKQQDVIAYRQEALAQFINALYQNKSIKTNMVFKEFVGI